MQVPFKSVTDIGDVFGKRVLVRIDANVPIKDGVVADGYRLKQAFPTISFLQQQKAKVILVGHLESVETTTLLPVFQYLKNTLSLSFVEEVVGETVTKHIAEMAPGDIVLLENIRTQEGEKKNDPVFARELAQLADFYVNEAFSVCHREHASIVSVPKLIPAYAGLLLQEEVKNLARCFEPEHPFLFILGGAKFETKLPLVERFLKTADTVFLAGALSNDVFKIRGYEVGRSVSSTDVSKIQPLVTNERLVVPVDVQVELKPNETASEVRDADAVASTEKIVDAGPKSMEMLRQHIQRASFILWNGPLGYYEFGHKETTLQLAKMIAERKVTSVIGGGDTLAAIAELGIAKEFTFVSTAGGAMLDFLAKGSLPGLDALATA